MPPRKKLDRKLLHSKKSSLKKRFSDTPKKGSPLRTRRNIITQSSEIMSEVSAISSNRRDSILSQDVSSTFNTSDMLKVSWKVFRVSPIYKFNEKALKTYARKLKEEITAFNCNRENVNYDCSFQFQKFSLHDKSYEIIKVSVNGNSNKYNGYFISFEENQCKKEVSDSKHFPVLLVEGRGKMMQQVHSAMCKFFDCDICPVRFAFRALTTFFTSLSELYIKDVSDLTYEAVTLHYKIPGCPQSDSIQVALSLPAASTVFAVFNSQFGHTLSHKQIISGYYERIVKHLLNIYQVDLLYAELGKVIFPGFAVSSEGWVKFASEDVLMRTLPIIGEHSQLQYIIY